MPVDLPSALAHHQAGRLDQAERAYRDLLEVDPSNADALHLLGVCVGQQGRADEAMQFIGQAIDANPAVADYHVNLAELLRRAGRLEESAAALTVALSIKPALGAAYNALGVVLKEMNKPEEAAIAFEEAVRLSPLDPAAHANFSNILRALKRHEAALAAARRAVELAPGAPLAHSVLGLALVTCGQPRQGALSLRRVVELLPQNPDAWVNLAMALREAGQIDESIEAARRAVFIAPAFAAAHNALGMALRESGKPRDAILALTEAAQLAPADAYIKSNLGALLLEIGQPDQAVAALRMAVGNNPDHAAAWGNLAIVLRDKGRIEESIEAARRAVGLAPADQTLASNLLYSLWFDPRLEQKAILDEHRIWGQRFDSPMQAGRPHHNARLRIAYLSADFRLHPVGAMLAALLPHHDPRAVEVFCYSSTRTPDIITDKIRQSAHHWRDIRAMTDDQVTSAIKADAIDIFIDSSLHMAGNRIGVLAQRPAPVCITWMGYPGSTGLSGVYRVTDRHLDPGDAALYPETSLFLPSFWCFSPVIDAGEVSDIPAQKNGYVTFGSFNAYAKVNTATRSLWAQVLRAVEGSCLLLQALPGDHREEALRQFEAAGVARSRIEFVDRCPHLDYMKLHHRVDLGLDPVPYGGHTTLLDALWMGVPAITLAGPTVVGRAGVSILSNVGLREFIARSAQDYVNAARAAAMDIRGLGEVRRSLRPMLQKSPLMKLPDYARAVEQMYCEAISGVSS